DRIIDEYHQHYPEYGFINNKGYGTKEHIQALKEYGPTSIHRYSFSVVNKYAYKNYYKMMKNIDNVANLKKLAEQIKKQGVFNKKQLYNLRQLYKRKYNLLDKSS
ncbi:MAG: ribonuclease HII, partial [Halothermotrichaceae bacterium]